MTLDPKKLRKLKKIADVLDKGDVAFVEHLFEIEEKIEETAKEIENKLPLLENVIEKVRGAKGDKGDAGKDGKDGVSIRGEKGEKGDRGPQGIPGEKGADSKIPGAKGDKGDPGENGKDGEMGIIDDATITYLEEEIKRVESQIQEGSRQRETNFGFVIRDITAGANITVDKTDPQRPIITGGAGGSKHIIQDEGTPLTARTNLNFVGSGVTVTDGGVGPDSTIVTISSGGSGITRSVSSVAINTTAGSTALTDYVYFTTATLTLTLPTAVGNINRYTVKCVAGTLTIDGAGAETIDGTATITVQIEDSVDLISNGTEFKVV